MAHLSSGYFSKNNIRERMFRVASDYFGIGRSETLDPVVCLFLEALGEEIYKVADEIDNLENRLLGNLSAMLVPDIDTIASPAHTVLHATSSDGVQIINSQTEFRHSALSFYPLCNARIYNGDVRYFVHDGDLYSVINDQSRILQATSRERDLNHSHTFWIGLELDDAIDNLSGISFFINLQNINDKELYASLLDYTQWKIQGQKLAMKKGLFSEKDEYDSDTQEMFSIRRLSDKINASIKEYYDAYYMTLQGDCDIKDKREIFPEALKKSFPASISENFKRPLLWIEVTCPQEIAPEIIHSLHVSINTFPVVNKRLVSETVKVSRILPFIPLRTGKDESFISVHSLSDVSGKKYYDVPLSENPDAGYGIYSLRRGGCECYNFRDADEFMSDLVRLLEGEAASLIQKSDYDKKLKQTGEDVQRFVKEIKKVISQKQERYEIENYILITPEKETEIYFVEYWLTNGTDANGITEGTRFRAIGLSIHNASLFNLLATTGGRQAPLGMDRKNSYRNSLSKQNLLITHDDITGFCKENFGYFFDDIQIRRGLVEMPSGTDFLQTTDLHLQLRKEMENRFDAQQTAAVEQLLKENSPATYKYRVFIN